MTSSRLAGIGRQTPRFLSEPESASSASVEAIGLARAAGCDLDPWQELCLKVALGENAGRWAGTEVGIIVPRQNGKGEILAARELAGLFLFDEKLLIHSAHEFKALDVETPILTPSGWTTMGALVDGDEVFAPDGQPTKVRAAHPVRYSRPCYRLRFDDGQAVVADAEHLWSVFDCVTRSRRVLSTAELVEAGVSKTEARTGRDRRTYRFRVDIPGPLKLPVRSLPVDPWLLGAWLGDGTSSKGELTSGAQDLQYLLGRLDALGETYRVRPDARNNGVVTVLIDGLKARLKLAGVLGAKRIPVDYLLAAEPQRAELLAGIMDTDGGVSRHRVHVTMIRRELMGDVLTLVRSLGRKATLREYRASIDGRDAGPMWRVAFTSCGQTPFGLPRKSAQMKPSIAGTRAHYNAIVDITPVPSRPTRCITVAHESSTYMAGFVPTHNTAREAFIRLVGYIERPGNEWMRARVAAIHRSHGEEGVELDNGNRLNFQARSTGSGRGFTGDCIILDEAYALTDLHMAAIVSTLSARSLHGNPQIWYTSSAPLDTSFVLHNLRRRGRKGEPRYAYLEWSAESVDDPEALEQANPALGIRIAASFIDTERGALSAESFARERFGIARDIEAERVIPIEDWVACQSPVAPEGGLCFGVDVDPMRAAAAIVCCDASGRLELIETGHGVGWLTGRIVELALKHRATVGVDTASPAHSFADEWERAGVTVRRLSSREMAGASGTFYDAVINRTIRIRTAPALDRAAAGARKRVSGDVWYWARKDNNVDVSPLVAASIARWVAVGFDGPSVYEERGIMVIG